MRAAFLYEVGCELRGTRCARLAAQSERVFKSLFSESAGSLGYLIQTGGCRPDGAALPGCAFADHQKLAAGSL
jgi:hypothetical protein